MNSKTIFLKDYQKLVSKIFEARKSVGMTQGQFAKKLKRTQSYISKIESAQVRVDILQLQEIAKILNKDINYFLN